MQRTETKGNLGTTICAVFLVKFREDNVENNTRNIFFFLFLFFSYLQYTDSAIFLASKWYISR